MALEPQDVRNIAEELQAIFRRGAMEGASAATGAGGGMTLQAAEALGDLAKQLKKMPSISKDLAEAARIMATGAAALRGREARHGELGYEGLERTTGRAAANVEDYFGFIQRVAAKEVDMAEIEEMRMKIALERQLIESDILDLVEEDKKQYLAILEGAEKVTELAKERFNLSEWEERLGKQINRDLFKRNALIAAGIGLLDRMIITFANLRQETGTTIGRARGLAGVGAAGMAEALGRGVLLSPREAAEVVGNLARYTETLGQITATTVANVAELQQRFGLSADEAARLVAELKITPGYTDEMTADMIKFADNLAQSMDMAPARVMSEMAKNAQIFAQHGAAAAESLTRAAVEAVRMGTSLETVEGFADRLVGDVEGTIEGFMRLRALGIDIGDPMELMRLAEAGETGELGRRLAERLQAQGLGLNIRSLGRVRARALEGVLRIDIEELARMAKGVGDLSTEAEVAAAQTAENRSIEERAGEAMLNLTQRTNEAVAALGTFALSLYASAGGSITGAARGAGGFAGMAGPGAGALARTAGVGVGGLAGGGIGLGVGAVTPWGNQAAAGVGGALGGAIGTFLLPGVGTVIGSVAGGLIAEGVVEAWSALWDKQKQDEEERHATYQRELTENQKALIQQLQRSSTMVLTNRGGEIIAREGVGAQPRAGATIAQRAKI